MDTEWAYGTCDEPTSEFMYLFDLIDASLGENLVGYEMCLHLITDNLYYDIQCSPQDYLPCMIYMMKFIENKNESIKNVFPLLID